MKPIGSRTPLVPKPPWLRVTAFRGDGYDHVAETLRSLGLNTVCQSANCPNRGECFNRGTATFLLLGSICTRGCRFCNIVSGRPAAPDPDEPARVAEAAARLNLRHLVVTSVTRDDLPDGGAAHFAQTVRLIRQTLPEATVEILTPDFKLAPEAIRTIIACRPDIFNHNLETVPRLYAQVRPEADYQRSLTLLERIGREADIRTKSGLMVGLGETRSELRQVFTDLAEVGVGMLTLGQYLAPSRNHHPVERYVTPEEFSRLREDAVRAGIARVVSAPLVRSSYRADEYLK